MKRTAVDMTGEVDNATHNTTDEIDLCHTAADTAGETDMCYTQQVKQTCITQQLIQQVKRTCYTAADSR